LHTRNFLAAHIDTCADCNAHTQCYTLLCLCHILIVGHHPLDWSEDDGLRQRALTRRQRQRTPDHYDIHGQDATFLEDKIAAWTTRGILQPMDPTLEPRPAPVFVDVKWTTNEPDEEKFADFIRNLSDEDRVIWATRGYLEEAPEWVRVKRRPIFDLRETNAARQVRVPFRFHDAGDAVNMCQPNRLLAAADFTEGYTSIPVSRAAAGPFTCTANGTIFTHTRLPFGYWAAPVLFCLVSGEAARQLHSLTLLPADRTTVYIDDTLFVFAPPLHTAAARFTASMQHMRHIGFRVQDTKTQRPSPTVEFLGTRITINPTSVSGGVPSPKLQSIHLSLQLALSETKGWPRRFWKRLAGKLQAAAAWVPGAAPHLGDLYSIMSTPRWHTAAEAQAVVATTRVINACKWFHATLQAERGTASSPWQPPQITFRGTALTDASGEGGLGGLVAVTPAAHTDSSVKHATFSTQTPRSTAIAGNENSTALEVLAIVLAVQTAHTLAQHWAPSQAQDEGTTSLSVLTDSNSARTAWTKGYSAKNAVLNMALAELRHVCTTTGTLLKIRWIPRSENELADALSHPDEERASQCLALMKDASTDPDNIQDWARITSPHLL